MAERKQRAQTCTHHCSSCGSHFHGKTAFDMHLIRVNQRKNRWGALEFDLDHSNREGLQVWTEDGACTLTHHDQDHVTIWQVVQTEAWLEHVASMQNADGDDSGAE